jgi:hypothetical protein
MATAEETVIAELPKVLAVAPWDRITYADAAKYLTDKRPSNYTVRKAYAVDQDHFQNGEQWVGPGDPKGNSKIGQQFSPDDAIGEGLSNIANAFGEPQVTIQPLQRPAAGQDISPEVQSKIDELSALLFNWWDKRHLFELVQQQIKASAWCGYAGLRLWIPSRFLQKTGNSVKIREVTNFEDAFNFVHVNAPLPGSGAIVMHLATQDPCAIFLDEEVVIKDGVEERLKRAELIYLDPERLLDSESKTYIRVVYEDPRRTGYTAELELGGSMMFAEMSTRALVTDPVIRSQQQLNFICSILTRLAETAGFRERYTKNARPQGTRYQYEEGDVIPTGGFLERDEYGVTWVIVPEERTLGANTTTDLVGLAKIGVTGEPAGLEAPDVLVIDPVDPTPYSNLAEWCRRKVLRLFSQGHLSGTSNAELSGLAYEQSRAVFAKDLRARRVSEEGMLRDFLTSVVRLVEWITKKPGYFTNYVRIFVEQHVDAGPRSPDAARIDMEAAEQGLLGNETVMSRLGVEDVDAELLMIHKNPSYILDLVQKAAQSGSVYDAEKLAVVLQILGVPTSITESLKLAPEPVAPVENVKKMDDASVGAV